MLENLRATRISQGKTQTFMAKKLGYRSVSGYANIEMGRTKPSLEKAHQISKLLNKDVAELFFDQKLHETSKEHTA
ncbi:helix-turn-helix transcriptional regulator [Bacillus velezensis]|uniref:helix-turn-helix transcriptional regulator n=1 Tax=Bacillus velezensis TaxID=492670 RepID=UPI001CCC5AA5|nr:helix-turn-helix transcriptional regulator [Bacillus velezensis]MDH3092706.1 helix-turn-helix transcriptional regulator [Bacillus velezensis]UBQ47584.1 helix-turn-helix domain-containing protein [Bacillus velezensis]